MANRTAEDIFHDALELPTSDRRAFVERECAGRPEVLAEVISLLRAFDTAPEFLESSPSNAWPTVTDQVGQQIGPYELTEHIGSGGAGDVYIARRVGVSFTQEVAVKIVRGASFGRDALRRFENECRLLARLDHPNIARMIDGGFAEDGTPYIAMELVHGEPIDQYCQTNHLSVEATLDLFLQLCAAVEHIHQHSTIHRDIKPGNILVTQDATVRLVDFGIARALDAADDRGDVTAAGLELMTPSYASPEQLHGDDLSTSTDVYSLGVVLFRLLTQELPFPERSTRSQPVPDTRRPPTAPSRLVERAGATAAAKRIRGDLDTIVLKALREEPEHRYFTVERFADDVRRHLRGLPVLARPATLGYRLSRLAQRNRWGFVTSVLLVLLTLGAGITGFALYARSESARLQAERSQATAEAVSEFLQDLLASASPTVSDAHTDLTVREVLDRAGQTLDRQFADPEVAAAIHQTMGAAYTTLGEFESAQRHLDTSIELVRSHELDDPSEADVLLDLALMAERSGDLQEAEAWATRSLEVVEARQPEVAAWGKVQLSLILSHGTRLDEARQLAEEGIAALENLDVKVDWNATARSALAFAAYRTGDYETAAAEWGAAAEIAEAGLGEQVASTGENHANRAVALVALGRLDEAIEAIRRAAEIYDEIYPPDHHEVGAIHINLADAQYLSGQYANAIASYAKGEEVLSASFGEADARVGVAKHGRAMSTWKLEGPGAARSLFEQANSVMSQALGPDHPWVASGTNNYARILFELGRTEEARTQAEGALAKMTAAYPDGHVHVARPLTLLGELAMGNADPALALAFYERAGIHCTDVPRTNSDRYTLELRRAECFAELGRYADAERELLLSIAAVDSAATDDDSRVEELRAAIANVYRAWNRPERAREYDPLGTN